MRQPPAPQPVAPKGSSSDTIAIVLGVVGFCCGLFGIAGAVMGLLSRSRALKAGQPAPSAAIGAIVLGVISTFSNFGLMAWGAAQNADRKAKVDELSQGLSTKLTAPTLDVATACALAQQYTMGEEMKLVDGFSCPGKFAPGPVSRLEGVAYHEAAENRTRVYCFARGHRWYVLSTPDDGLCPAQPPAVPAGAVTSEEGFQNEEAALRRSEQERGAKETAAQFAAQLQVIRKTLDVTHADKLCDHFVEPIDVPYVDYDLIPGASKPTEAWPMLSSTEMKNVLDPSLSLENQIFAIDAVNKKGHYLAVFQAAESKALPEVKGSDQYVGGTFDGWLSVVDREKGTVLCEAPLHFQSSNKVGGGVRLKITPKKSAADLVKDDFEDAFEEAATRMISRLSDGKLKLGLKLLE